MGSRISFSVGRAGRVRPGDEFEEWERPRFGFYWWLWLPQLHWNGGLPWRNDNIDVSLNWLCFWAGFVVWSRPRR